MHLIRSVDSKLDNTTVEPFLKWAGGKRWLVNSHPELLKVTYKRYIEPFLGGGAVFFYLKPKIAILSDKNKELIDTYLAIKTNVKEMCDILEIHQVNHCNEYYYNVRDSVYDSIVEKAAQFIYLNRTCWNGLYRVNQKNKFNVPIGTKNRVIMETLNEWERIATVLADTELISVDFEEIIDQAICDDFIFIDPPYTVKHNNNGFIKYNQHIFSWDDQVRLSKCVLKAKNKGAKIILTNADHESIRELYRDNFIIKTVPRTSVLAGKSEYRGKVSELLVIG